MPSLVGSEMCIRYSINAEYMGEKIADRQMKKQGYKKYPSRVGSNNGFDGVYIKFDKKGNVTDIVINESKFNTARLGDAYVGNKVKVKQMSDAWIQGNLNKMRISRDEHVKETYKLISKYLRDDNSVNKSLNKVRKPTKVKRKHTTSEWKNLGTYNPKKTRQGSGRNGKKVY
eukprot:TRINITY_DN11813_c0_g1_i1.p3 TRINITY_DN11813_c0_g1~~TRINITY_DN11813_c0_g1_i1.p3  ORF type:complete len:172 (-),score=30.87 TRINITY_DN11813_c0_g1_i1:160-675(-)